MVDSNVNKWVFETLTFADGSTQQVAANLAAGSNAVVVDETGVNLSGQLVMNGVTVNAAPPSSGQVLTATSSSAASWATPAAGSVLVYKSARIDMGTIASATPSLVTTYTWPSPFADNNYTITGSVVILETPPAGAATEIITVSSIKLSASGTGFSFVVCNASSGSHHVIANFIAIHD